MFDYLFVSLIICLDTIVIEIQQMCYYMGVWTNAIIFVCILMWSIYIVLNVY